jgi:competence protein ComEA
MWERISARLYRLFKALRLVVVMILLVLTAFTAKYLPLSEPASPVTYQKIASYPLFFQGAGDSVTGDGTVGEAVGSAQAKIKVSIAGAVANAGVYELDSSAIVADVVSAAGGFKKEVDKVYVARDLNLAKVLKTGEHFYIPFAAERDLKALVLPPAGGVGSGSGAGSGGGVVQLVNINTATSEQLQTLSGIGPSTADKIIAARPYTKIDDLLNVSGIGPATLEKIKNSITI